MTETQSRRLVTEIFGAKLSLNDIVIVSRTIHFSSFNIEWTPTSSRNLIQVFPVRCPKISILLFFLSFAFLWSFIVRTSLYAQDSSSMGIDEVMARVSFGRQQIRSAEYTINVVKKQTVTAAESGELFSEESENWSGHCYFDSSRSSSLMRLTRTGDLTKTIVPSPRDRKYVSRNSIEGFSFLDVEKE